MSHTAALEPVELIKGHGTGNDFVIVPDHDGTRQLSEAQVRLLCDRRRGIGGDGVLRVVRVAADAEASALAAELAAQPPAAPGCAGVPEWFMDYRNADGSLAEMCGNGVRVFAEYLHSEGLAGERFPVLTRGGVRQVSGRAGRWTVAMGAAQRLQFLPAVTAAGDERRAALSVIEIPNPHVVVRVPDAAALAALDLSLPPSVKPALPHGQNVEFVAVAGERSLAMRVHERGVGETLSCGTGICAAAVAMADSARAGAAPAQPEEWTVTVPGGECSVRLLPDGGVLLTGPAVLVARVAVDPGWLAAARLDGV